MVDMLFVYGSLMSDTASDMARFLLANAKLLGKGKLQGRLYDLGSYPGAVYDPEETNWITGQIYQLHHPAKVFAVLDDYEGVTLSSSAPAEYIRRLVPVQHQKKVISCWVYQYHLDTSKLTLIEGGDYLAYFKTKVAHRRFIIGGR